MWISFFAIMIYTGILAAILGIKISKLLNRGKKEVEELRQRIDNISHRLCNAQDEVYDLQNKMKQLAKYRVTLKKSISRGCYWGPSDKYSNEYFIDKASAELFVKNCQDWSNPVITDLKTNKPIPDNRNMENWERYVAEKLE